jgi:hypothetical protein
VACRYKANTTEVSFELDGMEDAEGLLWSVGDERATCNSLSNVQASATRNHLRLQAVGDHAEDPNEPMNSPPNIVVS